MYVLFSFSSIILNVVLATASRDQREFYLNRSSLCTGNHPYLLKVTSMNIIIEQNLLLIKANLAVNENLSNDLSLKLTYKRCKMDKNECFGQLEFPVPSLCALLTSKTIFGNGMGSSFIPKMACPIKKGTYNANLKLNMSAIASIPLDKTIYDVTLNFFDVTKKKELTCVNIIMWMIRLKS